MNDERLKKFLEDAGSRLPEMRSGIISYEQNPERLAELQTARRHAYALKGAATLPELSEIADVAAAIEVELKIIIQTKTALPEEKASELLSKILLLENNLSQISEEIKNSQQILTEE